MKFKKTLTILCMAMALAGCGNKAVEPVAPTESATTIKQSEVCITSGDGTPLKSSSGACWNPGYKEETVVPPATSATGTVLPPPPPASPPPPQMARSAPAPMYDLREISPAAGSSVQKAKPKPFVPKLKPAKTYAKVERPKVSADDILAQLKLANIVFVLPEKANIKEHIKAELLIDLNSPIKELEKQLTITGQVVSGEVLVSKVVTAKLYAPEFQVINITPEEQALSNSTLTRWKWELIPQKPGKYEVMLSISAKVKVDNAGTERYIGTYNKRLLIEISTYQAMKAWFTKYWQWIISTLALPLLVWWWKTRKKKE